MTVNPQITDSVAGADVNRLDGHRAGQVYQAIAQSMAIAIQDATDALRNINTIAATATAVAIAQMLGTEAPEGLLSHVKGATEKAATPSLDLAPSPHVDAARRMLAEAEADDVAYRLRTAIDATSASFESLGTAVTNELLRAVQVAATAACVKAMLAQPEKAASYEDVLAAIKRIVWS